VASRGAPGLARHSLDAAEADADLTSVAIVREAFVNTDREMLESALAADFDDLVAHHAYADLLSEQGDPRGEFIQVQLALENRQLAATERDRLKAREAELLTAHKRQWLGGLAQHLDRKLGPGGARPNCQFGLVRGWLRHVSVLYLDRALVNAVCRCPVGRLLHWMQLGDASEDVTEALRAELLAAPFLANLQTVELDWRWGQSWSEKELAAFVSRLLRIEDLHLAVGPIGTSELFRLALPNLRELHVTGAAGFALDVLAGNPTLGKLEELRLEPPNPLEDGEPSPITLEGLRAVCRSPHLGNLTRLRLRRTDFGDDGVRELIDSGLLSRLNLLDLPNGAITDEGAALLALRPELAAMEVDLRDNALTRECVELLEAAGEEIYASHQHEPGTTDYLYEFDME
jgi:uncharacterized protein (TIGR02996 family)